MPQSLTLTIVLINVSITMHSFVHVTTLSQIRDREMERRSLVFVCMYIRRREILRKIGNVWAIFACVRCGRDV